MNTTETLRDNELSWFKKLELKREELDTYQTQMGSTLAIGGELGEVSSKFAQLQADVRAIESTIQSVRAQRPQAIIAQFRAQASELRVQAAARRAERSELLKKASKYLRELSIIEGVEYTPALLLAQRNGLWANLTNTRIDVDSMSPFEAMHGSPNLPPFQKPKSRQLLDEAIRLEDEAEQLMQRKVPDSGTCEGGSLDELIGAMYSDPLRLGPDPLAIAEWVNTKEAAFKKSSPGLEIRKRRFQISWRDAELVPSQSIAEFVGEPRAELVA